MVALTLILVDRVQLEWEEVTLISRADPREVQRSRPVPEECWNGPAFQYMALTDYFCGYNRAPPIGSEFFCLEGGSVDTKRYVGVQRVQLAKP